MDNRLTAAAQIARFSNQFSVKHLTPDMTAQVGRALVDTVGVAIAGCNEPASRVALNDVADRHAAHESAAWGRQIRMPAEEAALYNGVAAHVLDYDDVNTCMRGHPSVALLPALMALAGDGLITEKDLAAAYVVGFEVIVKLSRAMVQHHYVKGWHSTTTIGTIGASVACSHLLNLTPEQTEHAIGLAVAQAAGTRANFGTMAKSFQAGNCAMAGVRSARLAKLGMNSSGTALDGTEGFTMLYGNGEDIRCELEKLGCDGYEIINSGIEIKKYPMCYATHRAIDGILDLKAEHAFESDSISKIEVDASRHAFSALIHHRPQTGLEAKFSMEFAVSAAATDGRIRLSSFTDASVQRNAIQNLIKHVHATDHEGETHPRWNRIRLTLRSGEVIEKKITHLRGSALLPMSDIELYEKWCDCLSFAGIDNKDEAFYASAMTLDERPVTDLENNIPTIPAERS